MRAKLIGAACAFALSLVTWPALAQFMADAGVYHLRNYVKRAHCDAAGLNCDLYPAFVDVMARCSSLRTKQGLGANVGCVINVPEGVHRLTSPVNICRQHTIQGTGAWGSRSAVTIFADGTAFIGRAIGYCQANSLGDGAYNARITGMSLHASLAAINGAIALCDDGLTATPCGNFGIQMDAQMVVEHVGVYSFTQGIRIVADVANGTNANVWWLTHVQIEEARDAGMYVQGGDVNSGTGMHININDACFRHETWKTRALGESGSGYSGAEVSCGGINDRSFLGNTYIGSHISGTRDQAAAVAYPNYRIGVDNPGTAYNACLGCYAEGSPASEMGASSMALGGVAGWTAETLGPSYGYRQYGSYANGIVYINKIDDTNRVHTTFGIGARVGMRIDHVVGGAELGQFWRIQFDTTAKGWHMGMNTYNLGFQSESGGTYGSIGELKVNCALAPNVTGCTP